MQPSPFFQTQTMPMEWGAYSLPPQPTQVQSKYFQAMTLTLTDPIQQYPPFRHVQGIFLILMLRYSGLTCSVRIISFLTISEV